ncbi:MAG: divalent cation tolerance protein CutA [Bacteroidota bacterium]
MEDFTDVKLEIFVPQEYALKIRDELAKIGVGRIGNYDHCVAMSPVQGYYRPLPGADPFEGIVEKISEVKEYKIEVNCRRELVNEAMQVIRSVHPYEEPLVNVIPLANHLFAMEGISGQ